MEHVCVYSTIILAFLGLFFDPAFVKKLLPSGISVQTNVSVCGRLWEMQVQPTSSTVKVQRHLQDSRFPIQSTTDPSLESTTPYLLSIIKFLASNLSRTWDLIQKHQVGNDVLENCSKLAEKLGNRIILQPSTEPNTPTNRQTERVFLNTSGLRRSICWSLHKPNPSSFEER